jgi:phospholipid/cholesterol/gamma-HCH transport system permease protein
MIAGILGGLLVSWASLDISPVFFVERLRQTVDLQHFWLGLIKTPVMAIIIALTGCRQGMAVRGDVEVLGRNVTTAVVQALFAIILLDAAFALVFMKLDL